MTPLAQYLLNDWCKPKNQRTVRDPDNALRLMLSAKCFDVTGIDPLLRELSRSGISHLRESNRVFCPADVVFLETNDPAGRKGILIKKESDRHVSVYAALHEKFALVGVADLAAQRGEVKIAKDFEQFQIMASLVIMILFLINTPRIVGKRVHQPHTGLQRKLAKSQGLVGKFPLHAWTEIKLWCDADDMEEVDTDEEIIARFSGQKCLHFVRSFLRWRNGRLERVSAHWRGNPALGMRRSRYICQPALSAPA